VLASQPDWFFNLPVHENELNGYGIGTTEEEAVSKAKSEIASTIQTRILIKNQLETTQYNKQIDERASFFVKSETDVVLSDIFVVKKELQGKSWYVAVKADTRSVENKLITSLLGIEPKYEKQNAYLVRTPLFKFVNGETGCTFNIKLIRNNGMWYLSYRNVNVCLNNDALQKLMVPCSSPDITILPSKSILNEGDIFSLVTNVPKAGYITLVNICQNGEVFLLDTNHALSPGETYLFPDSKSHNVLAAGLIAPGISTHDLYVAIKTETPLNWGRYYFAGDKVDKREWHYKFDEILSIMDEYSFAATLVQTEPR
jgi:hypothetical protein